MTITTICFLVYVLFTSTRVIYGVFDYGAISNKDKLPTSLLSGAILMGAFILNYYAGIYNHITGYEGGNAASAIWLILMTMGATASIIKYKFIGIVVTITSVSLIYGMDGLNGVIALF